MARWRKYTKPIICVLLGLVVVQFIALAGVLGVLVSQNAGQPAEEMAGEPVEGVFEGEPLTAAVGDEPQEGAVTEKEPPEGALSAPEILADAQVIAHGMGMIEGVTTLNCLESFRQQYEQGVRVFEVDLRMTADMQVVLRHDWRAGWQSGVSETEIPTLDEFRAKPLLGKYTPLTFRDLLLLMEEYPDVCIVTDSKFTDAETVTVQFNAMLEDARELGLSYLFDRIAVQVYSRLMFKVVDSVGDFPHYIYTLYAEGFDKTVESFTNIAAFCAQSGIAGITMWSYWWEAGFEPIARQYDVSVYVHTVNDAQEASGLLDSGVRAVYTDSIIPAELEALRPVDETQAADEIDLRGKGDWRDGIDGEESIRRDCI